MMRPAVRALRGHPCPPRITMLVLVLLLALAAGRAQDGVPAAQPPSAVPPGVAAPVDAATDDDAPAEDASADDADAEDAAAGNGAAADEPAEGPADDPADGPAADAFDAEGDADADDATDGDPAPTDDEAARDEEARPADADAGDAATPDGSGDELLSPAGARFERNEAPGAEAADAADPDAETPEPDEPESEAPDADAPAADGPDAPDAAAESDADEVDAPAESGGGEPEGAPADDREAEDAPAGDAPPPDDGETGDDGEDAPAAGEDDTAPATSGGDGAAGAEIVLDEEEGVLLYAGADGDAGWTLRLPPEGGPTAGPVADGGSVHVAHGLYLLEVAREDGTVTRRLPLPAPANAIAGVENDAVRVCVGDEDEEEEPEDAFADHPAEDEDVAAAAAAEGPACTLLVGGGGGEPVRFGAEPERFGWLQAAAAAHPDPVSAAERDPTDPWLALAAAVEAEDDETRSARLDAAVEAVLDLPFFEAARLARALHEADAPDRAVATMEAALQDFAARDYDPRLLTDPRLREAYGFPLAAMNEAVRAGELDTARRWAPFVWRLASEEAPETAEGLRELSAALRAAGERDAADLWRSRAAALQRAGLSTWLDRAALGLGRMGLWAVAALLIAFVAAWATLLAKVWRAQSLARRQRRERDEPVVPLARLWVPRHASTTEKIALALLLVLAAFATTLAAWGTRASEPEPALRSGTLASDAAADAIARLSPGPWTQLARGVSLHVRGEREDAEAAYLAAGERAPALTNLALLTGDESLLQAALRVDPREEVARFHLGRAGDPSPFHDGYREDEPLLAVPSPLELTLAAGGDWRTTLRETATAPWRALPEARPATVPGWAWWAVVIVAGLLLVALVISLFVPRPRASRDAPRTAAYHVLALLVPGSGHLDELWGLLLLVPWSLVGLDALLLARTGTGHLGTSLETEAWVLGGLYLANLVGFVVESASYRHRIQRLREDRPELARSYGLPARPVARDA